MKKGEIVWDKLGGWILLLIFLVLALILVFAQKERFLESVESIKLLFRFGGG